MENSRPDSDKDNADIEPTQVLLSYAVFAVIGSVIGTAAAWWFGVYFADKHSDWKLAIAALEVSKTFCIEVAAASGIFFVAHFGYFRKLDDVTRKRQQQNLLKEFQHAFKADIDRLDATLAESHRLLIDQIKGLAILGIREWPDLEKAPWEEFIERAETIDICVQGWRSWVKHHKSAWVKFFRNGGKLNLILPNPDNPEGMKFMEERLGRNPGDQREDIEEMYKTLMVLRDGSSGIISYYRVNKMIWYCAVRFDHKDLFLSVYEHIRFEDGKIESPTYQILLTNHEQTKNWLDKEFKGLMEEKNLFVPPNADQSHGKAAVK